MSVRVDGTSSNSNPTFDSVTVYDSYTVANKYSLPTGSPATGDLIIANGSQQLEFGNVSLAGFVTNPATANFDMGGFNLSNIGILHNIGLTQINTGANSFYMPTTEGNFGDYIGSDGLGSAFWSAKPQILVFFGGNLAGGSTNFRLNLNGMANSTTEANNRVYNRFNCSYDCVLQGVCWDSENSSATTTFDVLINGFSQGNFNLTGIAGKVFFGTPLSIAPGDSLVLRYTGGTLPGFCNMQMILHVPDVIY